METKFWEPSVDWRECVPTHKPVGGPNMDVAQCPKCLEPTGVRRPWGESFGWHARDCSLLIDHEGYCVHGGEGHKVPDGWIIRG